MIKRWLLAGVVTGIIDCLFSSVLVIFFYKSTFARLWKGVASVLLGKGALEGGTRTVLIGLAMHFGVALAWSAVFLILWKSSAWIRRVADSRGGVLVLAVFYGPLIWMVMSFVVIPLLAHRPPNINYRWWVQLFGHIFFVAIPIISVITVRPGPARAEASRAGT